MRQRVRRALLSELEQPRLWGWSVCTPMGLTRGLLVRQLGSGISTVAKTLHKLKRDGLVEPRGVTDGTQQRLYALSESGRRILHWLKR